MRRQQLNHQGEERRLGAAQIIAAVTVGDMAPGVEFVGKVRHHIADFVPVAALGQAQHSEVAVPVIDLTETPARHNIGFRQRKQ
ncbi:hypothetical protein D3C78_1065140 [compost metagenome]